ncbi:hypothetical protein [Nocardia sp. NPDC051832]|uniref:lipase/acyltransferase domain-containing protein n=1 Tax=Nocardia sp. NPDC051832 TaxID=3155673 RepID=UPI0034477B9F
MVIPGIMGSELIDTSTGKLLWGMRPGLLARMWTAPTAALAPLAIRDNRPGTVRPGGLLRVSGFCPIFAGIEPYSRLLTALHRVLRHPSAVLEFAYDWRLPVRHNAELLARATERHVADWRIRSSRPDAKVVLVAHSMGGLLCQALGTISGALEEVRAVVTLGTPFEGAAKAAVMLASGEGAPLPARRLREVAVTMPGLYDLLPSYRCVDAGSTVRTLTESDVADIGGDAGLARAAFEHRSKVSEVVLPGHRPMIGVEQPTMSSLEINAGRVEPRFHTFGVDPDGELTRDPASGIPTRYRGLGDGTVPRNSAVPLQNPAVFSLPQQHGPIATADEAITFVVDTLRYGAVDRGPRLGTGEIGLLVPDVVTVGVPFDTEVTGIDRPNTLRAKLIDVDSGKQLAAPTARRLGDSIVVSATAYQAGVFRIVVDGSGTSPVSQLLMAVEPSDR